ncbi:CK1 family protein kinase [Tritrichomonas foetus]|uniref:non-specific serine/threonine protein kinase n=1 Tax=Tritrichomonas foetus TaxID=1144522 RepID=A0A1J4JAZ3_9EUKA|nr:CK1 family protein kinase [Tritrichomonas foetus]|eukprot:OHS96328.1 CK1 family protein kinase [Tritrichomonas foetus]
MKNGAKQQTSTKGSELIGQIILNRYAVRKWLGGGSFGDVYQVEDMKTQQIMALKFENGTATNPQLPTEYKFYKMLQGMNGIPNVTELFEYNKNRVLGMDELGPSLESLFKRCQKRFSLKTVLMIADQLLRIIEYVHNSGILHRDIKPQNFLIGRGPTARHIFMVDFGVSTQYVDPRTGEHMMYTNNNGLVGTAHYVSVNTHLGDQQSRRDDLESIAYVLIRFLKGSLPWQGFKYKTIEERNEKITQLKIQTTPEMLCAGLPKEFKVFIELVKRLRYDDTPKYHWYRNLFMSLFIKKGYTYDGLFDWDENAAIHRPAPADFLIKAAGKYQRSNERQIRRRKENIMYPDGGRNIFMFGWRNT